MTLSGAQLADKICKRWFCVRSQPKHENLAARSLRQIPEIEVFAPHIRFRKVTRRGPVWFVEALFPGYLFAFFEFTSLHRHIRSLPGVSTLVEFGDRPAVIDHDTIDDLKKALGVGDLLVFDPAVAVGDSVHVASGPFKGLEAVVTRLMPPKERVSILLEFLGRTLEAEVGMSEIIPSAPPRGTR